MVGKEGRVKGGGKRGKGKGWWEKREGLRMVGKEGRVKGGKEGRVKGGGKRGNG